MAPVETVRVLSRSPDAVTGVVSEPPIGITNVVSVVHDGHDLGFTPPSGGDPKLHWNMGSSQTINQTSTPPEFIPYVPMFSTTLGAVRVVSRSPDAVPGVVSEPPNGIINVVSFVHDGHGDVPRVDGQLAVARAFGDKSLKVHLSATPDIKELEIVEETEHCNMGSATAHEVDGKYPVKMVRRASDQTSSFVEVNSDNSDHNGSSDQTSKKKSKWKPWKSVAKAALWLALMIANIAT